MRSMQANHDFEDQDGSFTKDEKFEVNDERALVLERQGKARREGTPAPAAKDAVGAQTDQDPLVA